MIILNKRIVCILMVLMLIFGCVSVNCLTLSAEVLNEKQTNSMVVNGSLDYSLYISKYMNKDYSNEDIVYKLADFVLSLNELDFEISVNQSGLYKLGMNYKVLDDKMSDIILGIKLDGSYPYAEASNLKYPRMWCDSKSITNIDKYGNEFAAKQELYDGYTYNEAVDKSVTNGDFFLVYLSKGNHKINIQSFDGKIAVDFIKFSAVASITKSYVPPKNKMDIYSGKPIIIEGEDAKKKSGYFLVGKSDTSSVEVSPNSPNKRLINYIGGGNWKTVGETIIWETPYLKKGYYSIGFSFRQNGVIGGKSYRTLTVDGKIPFSEAQNIEFGYGEDWQQKLYEDSHSNPYYIYLSEGIHEISLCVTSGDVGRVRNILTNAVSMMGDLYVDITKITGETVDIYRDYDLFKQIGDMEERLKSIRDLLEEAGSTLLEITGEKTGSNYSVIKNMVEVINQMLNKRSYAHRYKSYYYSNYCSVSSVLQDLRSMPLDLDKIVLSSGGKDAFEKVSFIKKINFSVKRFFTSFSDDYNSFSSNAGKSNDSINIWVSWGRDQAQVLNTLINQSFTPQTGIPVNVELVNATVIQGILSGKGPDCLLQTSRSQPVNLAMRNVLYNLSEFDDCDAVLERFQKGADIPYRYKGNLYALPDTQSFFVMFYRKDILEKYNLKVPKTWDEFDLVARLLAINNMNVALPNNVVTGVAQASSGVGANNIYPSLLLQNGVSLYADDGHKTNLISSEAISVFEKWTNYYSEMKFPVSLDFYNRFRTGTTPLGISTYNLYTTLKVAAPEIEGLWSFTSIPGTLKEDGTVSHATSGGGTGCSILKMSKNPEKAWEFLKWWTDAETQMTFSNDIESILGPTGRITLSNVEAVKSLDWENGVAEELISSWDKVEEIPEYPGSYYVSRSIYQAFWNVVNDNTNTKDMLMKYGKEADDEITKKWNQYANR